MKALFRIALAAFILMSVDLLPGLFTLTPASAQWAPFPVRRRPAQTDATQQSGVEVLTRGPVHEAFASPVSLDPEAGLLAPHAPPDPLDEGVPDEAPDFTDGDAEWIPGYWAWDDEENEYIWISGVWRVPPPGADWVPGRWTATREGYRWVPGFWSTDEDRELEYLPRPPQNLDEGPVGPPPSPDYIWVPGSWYFEANYEWVAPPTVRVERRHGYFWRPGYWLRARPDWTWIPARYVWSPGGVVFVDGHWDLVVERRGLLFAPVRVARPLFFHRRIHYVPQIVISTDIFTVHLFTRPSYVHYYFGDYYAPEYVQRGIQPWFEIRRGCYDPIYVTYAWRYRDNVTWLDGLRRTYERRRVVVAERPPRTYRVQLERVRRAPEAERRTLIVGRSVRELRSDDARYRFRTLDEGRRTTITRNVDGLRDLRRQRATWEAEAQRPAGDRGRTAPRPGTERLAREGEQDRPRSDVAATERPYRVKLPASSISGRQGEARRAPAVERAPTSDTPTPRKVKRTSEGIRR